jgi:hypothetical protein
VYHRQLDFKIIFQKSWQKRYCRLYKWSKHGIDRLEVFDGIEEQKLSTIVSIIPLESCVKITQDAQKHQPNVFAVSDCIFYQ